MLPDLAAATGTELGPGDVRAAVGADRWGSSGPLDLGAALRAELGLANLRSAWCEVARQSGGNVPTSVVPQTPSREVVARVASPPGSPNSLNISG